MPRINFFQIVRLHVFHQQVKQPRNFAVLHIPDYPVVSVDFFQNFAPAQKTASRQQIKSQPFVQAAQRVGLPVPIRRQPNIRHSPAVEQLLEVETSKRSRRGRGLGARFVHCANHQFYLSRAPAAR